MEILLISSLGIWNLKIVLLGAQILSEGTHWGFFWRQNMLLDIVALEGPRVELFTAQLTRGPNVMFLAHMSPQLVLVDGGSTDFAIAFYGLRVVLVLVEQKRGSREVSLANVALMTLLCTDLAMACLENLGRFFILLWLLDYPTEDKSIGVCYWWRWLDCFPLLVIDPLGDHYPEIVLFIVLYHIF